MKRFLIVAVAALAAVLFTACPDKPKDEPVVIPDGTYEETAHFQRQTRQIIDNDSSRIVHDKDTMLSTTVIIDKGDFIYPDMCDYIRDSLRPNLVFYASPFIYEANTYCRSNRIPAKVSEDGRVIFKQPIFVSYFGYAVDSTYIYRAPISMNGGTYMFNHSHDFTYHDFESIYHISHTLRPL